MSGVTEKASVEASLKGGDQVNKEAGKIRRAFADMGKAARDSAEKGVKALRDQIGGTITDSLRAASVLQTINLASGIESAKRFTAETSKLARMSGDSFGRVGSQLTALEGRTLTSADAVGTFARSLGRATYDAKSAIGAITGLGDFAQATGRDLEEGLDIGATLRSSLGVVGDVSSELERLRSIGESVGTKGGYTALVDTLAAIKSQLDQVAVGSDKARAELEAMIAVTTKGLKPSMAAQVAGGLLGTIKGRALDIERLTGHRVLDDDGNVANPLQSLKDLKRIGERKFGKDKEGMRRAYLSEFGPDLGSAILRADTSEIDRVTGLKGKGAIGAEAKDYRNSPEAQRKAAEIKRDAVLRGAGEKFLGAESWLIDKLGVPGALGANIVGLPLAAKGVGGLANMGINAMFGGGATAGGGGGAASGLGQLLTGAAGAAALPLAMLGGVGLAGYMDIQSTAPDYERARQRDKQDANLAEQSGVDVQTYRRLRASGTFGESGQPGNSSPDLQVDAINQLVAALGNLKTLPQATADAIKASNIVIQLPSEPNADKAN